jgi:hypothetical protein
MRTLRTFFLACVLASTAAHATDREFKDVVNAIADEFHTRPTHIPFFGLVNVVTFVARPAGTKHIELALFENLDSHVRDGRDLARSVRRAVGSAWKPFVQVWSHRDGHEETVLVYMRMEGRDCRFLVASIEPNEATVVEVKLNPEGLQKWLVSPRESAGHHWNRERGE